MILADILDFLGQREAAGLGEIARHVGAEPEAVRAMLQTLMRKGKVYMPTPATGCGSSCQQCGTGSLEVYAAGRPPAAMQPLPRCRSQRRP